MPDTHMPVARTQVAARLIQAHSIEKPAGAHHNLPVCKLTCGHEPAVTIKQSQAAQASIKCFNECDNTACTLILMEDACC